jgi:hypothetical protein
MSNPIDVVRSIVRDDPPAPVGKAAPAGNGTQQSGSATPAGNGNVAGNPSIPSSVSDAIVAEKKKAEHWQKKYERDTTALRDQVSQLSAKFDGLTTGLGVKGILPSDKPASRPFADLDANSIEEIAKKGIEESNPGYLTGAMRELMERTAAAAEKRATENAQRNLEHTMETQRVAARINAEFGAAVLDQDSELRQRADEYAARALRVDPQILTKIPDLLYHCFASADRDLKVGEKAELDVFRKQDMDRRAREELERSRSALVIKARDDVAEKLKNKDIKGALIARLPWLNKSN